MKILPVAFILTGITGLAIQAYIQNPLGAIIGISMFIVGIYLMWKL